MKNRFLSTFLVIMTCFITLCGMMSPAHACCQKSAEKVSSTLPDCCLVQGVVQPQPQTESNGFGPTDWTSSASATLPSDFWALSLENTERSKLAHRYWPDQSNRHMELSIWLN